MGKPIVSILLMMAAAAPSQAQTAWLTAGNDAYQQVRGAIPGLRLLSSRAPAASLIQAEQLHLLAVPAAQLPRLSRLLHEKRRHCGGFMHHPDQASAQRALLAQSAPATSPMSASFPVSLRPSYEIGNQSTVTPALAMMRADAIGDTIARLSAFPNRLYNSAHGAAASAWLRDHWTALAAPHAGIVVAPYPHAEYGQASVVATIAGSDLASQVVVIGAHLDSISSRSGGSQAAAPGADDDASGVAGLTEMLRVAAASAYAPRRTIKLIAYAAEEVGLRGSQAIARAFKKDAVEVVGVLQLDMTNYQGSPKDIYLISDYTDAAQNSFLEKLIASYLPGITIGYDRCGYACSDHASWQAEGYVTSMPFEAALAQGNPHIHSHRDTYANSGKQALHALKFTRLGAAYMMELGASTP